MKSSEHHRLGCERVRTFLDHLGNFIFHPEYVIVDGVLEFGTFAFAFSTYLSCLFPLFTSLI